MKFEFTNKLYRYEIEFSNYKSILRVTTYYPGYGRGSVYSSFSITNNKIEWVDCVENALHISKDVKDYINKCFKMKAFW